MTLEAELRATHEKIEHHNPKLSGIFDADTDALVRSGIAENVLKEGRLAPDFELPDQLNRMVRLSDVRAQGPVVIAFYRGNWCPYCNLELRSLQQYLPQVKDLGASLIAISPQLPDESISIAEKHELTFPVLSDVDNIVARRFGLVFVVSEHLRPLYASVGIDLPKSNGSTTFELPIPATFILDQTGIVRKVHANPDYKTRMEPSEIVATLAEMRKT